MSTSNKITPIRDTISPLAELVSIVIPVYNESANLAALWTRLEPVVSALGRECEVIFIDDGSRDDSLNILQELASDDRFKDIAGRARNRDELNGIVQGWIDSVASDEEVLALLEEHRVPHAPVLSVEEAINHPHLRARGTVTEIEDQFIGKFDVPGFPLRFSAFPEEIQQPAPTLGQHNSEVLRDYLGYSSEQIVALEADGILHRGER